jgi:hypothetical protein
VFLAPAAAQAPAEVSATVVGQVVRAWVEPRTQAAAGEELHTEPLTWIEPESGGSVRVPTNQAQELPLGATVEVTVGAEVVDEAATEGGQEPAHELLAAEVVAPADETPTAPASPPFTNQVTVAMVVPAGGVQDATTLAQVVAAVDGPAADFWEQESNGAIRLGVTDQNDWYQATADCSDAAALWDEVAAHVGFVDGPGKHLLLYLPGQVGTLPDCAYGLAEVRTSTGDGGRLYVRDTVPSVIVHELGHNFSLGHSGSLTCVDDVEFGNCAIDEYGDLYDVMGYSWDEIGTLSAPQADRLGFLPSAQQFTFTAGGRGGYVTLAPAGGRSGMRAVRLVGTGGVDYWVEYRSAVGQDAWLGDPSANLPDLHQGLQVRSTELMPDLSMLLDATPPSSEVVDLDVEMLTTETVQVSYGEFTLSVKIVNGSPVLRVATAASDPFPRDWTGDNAADLFAVDGAGTLRLYPGSGVGGFLPPRAVGSGWQSRDLITMAGDWDGDGRPDMIARNPANGDLWLYRGNDNGGFLAWGVIGRGWNVMDMIIAPGDWDGDGNVDLLTRRKSAADATHLYLYRGNGRGGFAGAATALGNGWQTMNQFAVTGDWNSDGVLDFVARDRWDGTLYRYWADGSGGILGRQVIGRGWQVFTAITGPGDWSGDGYPDLITRKTDGTLWLYTGNGVGGFSASWKIGSGWTGFRLGS